MQMLNWEEMSVVAGGACDCTLKLLGWGGYKAKGGKQCDIDCASVAKHAQILSGAICGAVACVSLGAAIMMKPELVTELAKFAKSTTISLLKLGDKEVNIQ